MCASQEQSLDISTPKVVYWCAIGTVFHLPTFIRKLPLHYIQLLRTFYVLCDHVLVYPSAFSICFWHPSGNYDIPTNSSENTTSDTASSPTVTPCLAASTATIMSLLHTPNKWGDSVRACATPCKICNVVGVTHDYVGVEMFNTVFITLRIDLAAVFSSIPRSARRWSRNYHTL